MQVRVKPVSYLKKYLPEGEKVMVKELTAPVTVAELLALCGFPEELQPLVTVNGRRKKLDYRVADGDEILIAPPAAGG
ncbi:MAG TPA: MoaD/ThiS family protein [Firmicutes bacterium]|uniref:MoaD/ThiS family protein n=1 Tax=Gelria sp. Kuro-4 TaxID=2796927 RepID=UPI0019844AAC|nr:MoaD/ThiS family protein [Gelria sp. Kuro-4]BCV23567.1 hypothetical protein kuro4_03400 [Gelria sp. Kuro-4]HHV58119.1 MoaD/ThiS family protein [Bacillota bacterium]